jgi:nitrite reductase (NADH) small subunit
MNMVLTTIENPSAPKAAMTAGSWVSVCSVDDVVPGTGVAALVDGEQVAIVRSPKGDTFYGLSNFDPYSKAFVIARGIVGDRGGVPKVASPIFKQSFDLRTGVCLDEPAVALTVYPVRVIDGRVEVLSGGISSSRNADAE